MMASGYKKAVQIGQAGNLRSKDRGLLGAHGVNTLAQASGRAGVRLRRGPSIGSPKAESDAAGPVPLGELCRLRHCLYGWLFSPKCCLRHRLAEEA